MIGTPSHSTARTCHRPGVGDRLHESSSKIVAVGSGVGDGTPAVRVGLMVFVAVGEAPGVGVTVAQFVSARQAALRIAVHPVRQPPPLGSSHSAVPHWQQSLAPSVGVGVKVAQLPAVKHAARDTGVHPALQPPILGAAHCSLTH